MGSDKFQNSRRWKWLRRCLYLRFRLSRRSSRCLRSRSMKMLLRSLWFRPSRRSCKLQLLWSCSPWHQPWWQHQLWRQSLRKLQVLSTEVATEGLVTEVALPSLRPSRPRSTEVATEVVSTVAVQLPQPRRWWFHRRTRNYNRGHRRRCDASLLLKEHERCQDHPPCPFFRTYSGIFCP